MKKLIFLAVTLLPLNVHASEPNAAYNKLIDMADKDKRCTGQVIYFPEDNSTATIAQLHGYYHAAVLTFARTVCRSHKDPVKRAMLTGSSDPRQDTLTFLNLVKPEDLKPAPADDNVPPDYDSDLKKLFSVIWAHAIFESSGNEDEGRDPNNPTSGTSGTAEAGLLQTSYNVIELVPPDSKKAFFMIMDEYKKRPSACFSDLLAENRHDGGPFYGNRNDEGLKFQKWARSCGGGSLEQGAVVLRHAVSEYKPINHRYVHPICEGLIDDIYALITRDRNSFCKGW